MRNHTLTILERAPTLRENTMQFDVTIQRTEYREHIFRVEAEDSDAAFHAGLEAARDYDFHDSPVDAAGEDVTAIVPVMPNAANEPRKADRPAKAGERLRL